MELDKMIGSGMKVIDSLEKRMAAKPSAKLADSLGAEAIAVHTARIEARIARLYQQRSATLARIDAALESEHEALRGLRQMAESAPAAAKPSRPGAAKPR